MEEYQNCNCIDRLEDLGSTVQSLRFDLVACDSELRDGLEDYLSYLPAAENMPTPQNTPQYMKLRAYLTEWENAVDEALQVIWRVLQRQRRNGHTAPATRRQSRRLLKKHHDLVRNVRARSLSVYDHITKALASFSFRIERNYAEFLIPSVDISKQQAENGDQCAVCLETFEVNETVRQLGCEHCFHTECMESLIEVALRERKNNFRCPLCRRPFLARLT